MVAWAKGAGDTYAVLLPVEVTGEARSEPAPFDLYAHLSIPFSVLETLLQTLGGSLDAGSSIIYFSTGDLRDAASQNLEIAATLSQQEGRTLVIVLNDAMLQGTKTPYLPPDHPVALLLHPRNWNAVVRSNALAAFLRQPRATLQNLAFDLVGGSVRQVRFEGRDYYLALVPRLSGYPDPY